MHGPTRQSHSAGLLSHCPLPSKQFAYMENLAQGVEVWLSCFLITSSGEKMKMVW